MLQGMGSGPFVGNFHLEVLRLQVGHPVGAEELKTLAIDGLKADMELLADQRKATREFMKKAKEYQERADLCPMCGTYLNSVPAEKTVFHPDDGSEIDPCAIPATKEAAEACAGEPCCEEPLLGPCVQWEELGDIGPFTTDDGIVQQ
ncbi:hypothetical protein KAR91_12370 [Candidatus Pacearchaeota archaeon]|nr:hypothetical protein [Candidatus Pacearchaeota archaeon]